MKDESLENFEFKSYFKQFGSFLQKLLDFTYLVEFHIKMASFAEIQWVKEGRNSHL